MKTPGERLSFITRKLGISNKQLIQLLGLSQSTISRYKRFTELSNNCRDKMHILNELHNVDLHWIQTGLGQAFGESYQLPDHSPNNQMQVTPEDQQAYAIAQKAQEETIATLKDQIQDLKKIIAMQDKIIKENN